MITTSSPPIEVAEPGTEAWHEARSTGIGASEAAAACGLSPYQTPLELYHRKRGDLPAIEDNDAMRLGRKLEPIIKSEFTLATGRELYAFDPPMYRHPVLAWQLATPDGELLPEAGSEIRELLECKSTSSRTVKSNLGDDGTDEIPESWLFQCQHQMAVCSADMVHVAALIDGRQMRIFRVQRHDALIEMITRTELELWEMIQAGTPPDPDWTHGTTLRLIRQLYGAPEDETDIVSLEEAIVSEWELYEDCNRQIRELKERQEQHRAKVLYAIGSHAGGFLGDGRMIRRKLTHRKSHTVAATSFVDVRAVNVPKGLEVRL